MDVGQIKPPAISESDIYLGVSSCLIGQEVRYDGGHKRDPYITDVLSQYFKFAPFCPEVAIGLGVPRPAIRLEREDRTIKAVIPDENSRDITDMLFNYGKQISRGISHISGYIFKSRSPSCGMDGVMIFRDKEESDETSTGIYARAIMESHPLLPAEEEDRLNDPVLRDNFIERVFIYHRWQCLEMNGLTTAELLAFHSEHKLLIMAHHRKSANELDRLIADCNENPEQTAVQYKKKMMQALKRYPCPRDTPDFLQRLK